MGSCYESTGERKTHRECGRWGCSANPDSDLPCWWSCEWPGVAQTHAVGLVWHNCAIWPGVAQKAAREGLKERHTESADAGAARQTQTAISHAGGRVNGRVWHRHKQSAWCGTTAPSGLVWHSWRVNGRVWHRQQSFRRFQPRK